MILLNLVNKQKSNSVGGFEGTLNIPVKRDDGQLVQFEK